MLEQAKYEEYLRTEEGILRCKPWHLQRRDKDDPPEGGQAGGTSSTNINIYMMNWENEEGEEEEEEDTETDEQEDSCPETNDDTLTDDSLGRTKSTHDPSTYIPNSAYSRRRLTGEQAREAAKRWPQESPGISIHDYEDTIRDRRRRTLNQRLGKPDETDTQRSPI